MRIAYLDCFSGMSGDMFLGALVDAGVPPRVLEETVAALDVGARLEISRVTRSGITATKVDVYSHGEKDLPREVYWEERERSQGQQHGHDHVHDHHGQDYGHEHDAVALREHNFTQEPSRVGVPAPHEHGHGASQDPSAAG